MLANDQFLNNGRYRIVSTFGQNDTGMYEAYDTVSNTTVVLKETIGSLGKITTSSQMETINLAFLGGAKTLTEIRHESMVSVKDYFADIDRQYLVFEPVTGEDLSKFLRSGEPRPSLSQILAWADQILDALQYLHTLPTPIIHGDIRPENVKVTSASSVKLLTSHADLPQDKSSSAQARSSDDGSVHYRPLEQLWDGLDALSQRVILNHFDEDSERWLRQPLSAATDLYALGATLYAVLTGMTPPDALDRSIAALEGKADPLEDPASINPAVPPEISDVILKSMALRREDRFYSAVILRQILHSAAARVKEREAKTAPVVAETNAVEPEPFVEIFAPAETRQGEQSAEQRRLELEAEQKRLDEEKLQLEQRRIELDAEMELQHAEEARLEREAVEARQKFEQESLATEAEQERIRLENERAERESVDAHEVEANLMVSLASDFAAPLLELDPVGISVNGNDDFKELLEVPEISVSRGNVSADTPGSHMESDIDFALSSAENQSGKAKWRLPAIAVAFVLVAAAAVGVWQFKSAGLAASPTASDVQPLVVPQQTDIQPPTTETFNATAPADPTTTDMTVSSSPETVIHDKNMKPVQPNAVQDKTKKQPVAAPAKTTAPKKAVTVDDLINDH